MYTVQLSSSVLLHYHRLPPRDEKLQRTATAGAQQMTKRTDEMNTHTHIRNTSTDEHWVSSGCLYHNKTSLYFSIIPHRVYTHVHRMPPSPAGRIILFASQNNGNDFRLVIATADQHFFRSQWWSLLPLAALLSSLSQSTWTALTGRRHWLRMNKGSLP